MMKRRITASLLYNLIQCPQRVYLDEFGDTGRPDPVDAFVQLLWDRGNTYERNVVAGFDISYEDMTQYHGDEREKKTREAMDQGSYLIYSARLSTDELLGDLTLLPELGRSKRDILAPKFPSLRDLADADLHQYLGKKKGATIFPGIGAKTLERFQERAKLMLAQESKPYFREAFDFPSNAKELFFDIETDPMQGVCYLHGFMAREHKNTDTEIFQAFMMRDGAAEEEEFRFAQALEFIRKSRPCVIYIYSKYERSIWRQLAKKYPSIASPKDIEEIFTDQVIDLLEVLRKHMIWPTRNHSIKTLAQFCGFKWRDEYPSGALSIKWYQDFCKSRDPNLEKRILDYNEDDCRAMRVLVDYLGTL